MFRSIISFILLMILFTIILLLSIIYVLFPNIIYCIIKGCTFDYTFVCTVDYTSITSRLHRRLHSRLHRRFPFIKALHIITTVNLHGIFWGVFLQRTSLLIQQIHNHFTLFSFAVFVFLVYGLTASLILKISHTLNEISLI